MSIGCDVCPTLMARDYKQSHIVCYMEVWPHIINNIESNGSAAMVGALEYHATVEIYPKEQEV